MKNKLIVFEGIDGVGKTTLSRLLRRLLTRKGIKAVRYEDIENKRSGFNALKPFVKKEVAIDASLLFYFASAIDKSQRIEKLLRRRWVICDRYIYSTLAFHAARGAKKSLLDIWLRLPIRLPDILFLITVKEQVRLVRMRRKIDVNANDLVVKARGNIVWHMEKKLKKFKPIIVDNTSNAIGKTLESVFDRSLV